MRISMEDELFPKQQIPLSTSLKWTNEKVEDNTYGYNAAAGVARTLLSTSASHLRHSQVQISAWGLLPKPCLRAGIVTRQWRFEIRVFLSLDGLLTATLLSPLLLPVYTEPVFATWMPGAGLGGCQELNFWRTSSGVWAFILSESSSFEPTITKWQIKQYFINLPACNRYNPALSNNNIFHYFLVVASLPGCAQTLMAAIRFVTKFWQMSEMQKYSWSLSTKSGPNHRNALLSLIMQW